MSVKSGRLSVPNDNMWGWGDKRDECIILSDQHLRNATAHPQHSMYSSVSLSLSVVSLKAGTLRVATEGHRPRGLVDTKASHCLTRRHSRVEDAGEDKRDEGGAQAIASLGMHNTAKYLILIS